MAKAARYDGRAAMRGPFRTRLLALLFASSLAGSLIGALHAEPARATSPGTSQSASVGAVTMTLVEQSAWSSATKPLTVAVRVTNQAAATLTDLSVVLQLGSPTRSRSAYELSLRSGPGSAIFAFPYPQGGELSAGASRVFKIRTDLTTIPTVGSESALYPLRIDLRSVDQTEATIRTPVIFLAEAPSVPLNLAWGWVLSTPMQLGPDGVFQPGPIEAEIAPGGRLDQMVQALDRPQPFAADVVLSPVLLTQLERMQRGYRIVRPGTGTVAVPPGTGGAADAGRLLDQLRSIASRRTTELEGLPFGDVSIPAILDAGFGKQLAPLIAEGASIVQTSLTPSQNQGAALGPTLSSSVVRPVGSALDPASLAQLVAHGARILLIDPGFVPTQVGLPFSPPALARLAGSAGRVAIAILPDTGVAAAATQDTADPVLAAHAALGEMAASYFEFPGTVGRGVAMLFPERPSQPAGFFPAIAGLVASSPWLRTVTATAFAGTLPAPASTQRLASREFPTFDPAYLAQLKAARAALRQFEVTVIGDERQKDELTADLHQCIAGTFVTSPALGERYVQRVRATIARTYSAITLPPDGAIVTLTSRRGTLPLTVRNSSPYSLRARIKLLADPRITFDGGGSRIVRIPPGNTPLEFSVNAQTTGRFPMAIRVETLDGSRIAGTQMIVRSTAYNRVALLVTIGAGLFLAIWWGRRFLPRRTS